MKRVSLLSLAVVTAAYSQCAASAGTVPTHCHSAEYTYLTAVMGTGELDASFSNKKNGKVLSLCADRQHEPFGQFVYRYGPIGAVEMERAASPSQPFYVFGWADRPIWYETIFFSVGPYTYHVTESMSQGHGVSLQVFKSGKLVADLFSGLNRGTDYESIAPEIEVERPASRLFSVRKPVLIIP